MSVNKYQKWYDSLILKAQSEIRSKKNSYYERHHILPRSMGGTDDPTNLVLLTAREHYIAHLLLVRFVSGHSKYKMVAALARFFKKVAANSHNYELYKKTMSKYSSGEYNSSFGKIWIHNTFTKEIHYVRKTEFDSYDKSVYSKGLPEQRGGYRGYTWIYKGPQRKAVSPERMEQFLNDGWIKGRYVPQKEGHYDKMSKARNTPEKNKRHSEVLTGRICMINPTTNVSIKITKDQEQQYIDSGFVRLKESGISYITSAGKQCSIDGKLYKSVNQAAQELGLSYTKVKNRLLSDKFTDWFYVRSR